jgi:glycosyltransferase involved in cell wall biosynthesis
MTAGDPATDTSWCVVIPFYNHPASIGTVIDDVRALGLHCYLVNDGSDRACDPILAAIVEREASWLNLIHYRPNEGKGRAVMTGIDAAARDGYSHVLQIDADGQHRAVDAARLVKLSMLNPDAMIAGYAVYDASVPRARYYGRYLTHVWVWINTLSLQIRDSMCGLRVYPVAATLAAYRAARGFGLTGMSSRMSFDTEILVRLLWRGVRILNAPVPVIYPIDGVSHFDAFYDNVLISAAHAKMFLGMLWRSPLLVLRGLRRNFGRQPGKATP